MRKTNFHGPLTQYSIYRYITYLLKKTSMYFPKRLELSLRIVLALPNASSSGLASRIYSEFEKGHLKENFYKIFNCMEAREMSKR